MSKRKYRTGRRRRRRSIYTSPIEIKKRKYRVYHPQQARSAKENALMRAEQKWNQ